MCISSTHYNKHLLITVIGRLSYSSKAIPYRFMLEQITLVLSILSLMATSSCDMLQGEVVLLTATFVARNTPQEATMPPHPTACDSRIWPLSEAVHWFSGSVHLVVLSRRVSLQVYSTLSLGQKHGGQAPLSEPSVQFK